MRDFRLIYKVLTAYKGALTQDGAPLDELTPEKLGTTEAHVRNIQHVLRNAGMLNGINGQTIISLAGLEYLTNNEKMLEIANERKPYSY